jgi:hypothetical protein
MKLTHGEPISEILADIIKQWTNAMERDKIAINCEYSTRTVKALVSRERNISKENESMMIEVSKLAFLNQLKRKQRDNSMPYKKIYKSLQKIA